MGIPVFCLGRSGTGKSTSLRNFKSDEILHINVMSKPLPFKGRFAETYNGDSYGEITKVMGKTTKKVIVIDDAQYLMANEFMRRSGELGYQKFTDIANNFWSMMNNITNGLPADTIVYILMHTDMDDQGNEKAKTIGKLLDEKICLEGMTSIVLKTSVKDGVYSFLTQNNGHDTTKSPLGMFDNYEIDNDLKAVDTIIRDYWALGSDGGEIMEQHDTEVDAGGVSTDAPKPEKRERKRRNRDAEAETPVKDTDKPVDAPTEDKGVKDAPRRTRRQRAAESVAEVSTETPTRSRRRRAKTEHPADVPFETENLPEIETTDDGGTPF